MKEAMLWDPAGNDVVECSLCSHRCKIVDGKRGICGVRENQDGTLYSLVYGKAIAVHLDPIEKKPLYHFHPGTDVMSFGTVGCNFRCGFCQNWDISQRDIDMVKGPSMTPEDAVAVSLRQGAAGIAWTYNEPTIWFEFTYEASKLAKKEGLYTCYVTNGYMTAEALETIAPYLDAMNIDVKSFDDGFYSDLCGSHLEPVKKTCRRAVELGIHIELTTLIVPGGNDSREELDKFTKWVHDELGPEVPVHFSRFHGDYKMSDLPPTPAATLEMAYDIAKENGLAHVFLGNIRIPGKEDTYCPKCNNTVISRSGFSARATGSDWNICSNCGSEISVIL